MNRFERLRGANPLVVYIDLKSPYAFISIEPTRAVARAAGVAIEWRPFTLDIPSYLGSARLDGAGRVVESRRSAAQWSGVRYAYRDARRYARLAGHTLLGTEKIWDSSLAGIGLLWAARQSAVVTDRYLDACYPPFWQRQLDIEDPRVVTERLRAAGADVAGFAEFLTGAGRLEHDRLNAAAFAAGVFGVPTYLVEDECWFGREHLPRVAWLLGGRVGPAPEVAYPLPTPLPAAALDALAERVRASDAPGRGTLRVAVDLRDPDVWLGFGPLCEFAETRAIDVEWLPFQVAVAPPVDADRRLAEGALVATAEEDRGTAHRRLRTLHRLRCVETYARARALPLGGWTGSVDPTAAHAALLWARHAGGAAQQRFLARLLADYWSAALNPADPVAIRDLLADCAIPADGFLDWFAAHGAGALAAARSGLAEQGVVQVPACLLGDELFQGRGHLPLIGALLDRLAG